MKKLFLAILLFSLTVHAQVPGTGEYGLIESLSPGGGSMTGPFAYSVCTQTADDTTPDMGSIPGGCNILETSSANTGATAVTDIDGPVLPGMIIYIVGGGGANPTTIADAGNFNLETAWTGETDQIIVLYVQAVGDFVEVGRIGGNRVFDGDLTLSGGGTIATSSSGDLTLSPDDNGKIAMTATLSEATGNQIAYDLSYTVNKATSGNDIGLYINQTDTASPGSSYLADFRKDGAQRAYISNGGTVFGLYLSSQNNLSFSNGSGSIITTSNGDLIIDANGTGSLDVRDLMQQGDGTYSWGHSPTGAGFEGKVEFDGYCYFDSNMYVYNAMYMQAPSGFIGYDGGFTQIRQSANDGLLFALYGSASTYHNMIISSQANALKNHDHTAQTNPTLHIHSVTDPDSDNTQFMSLTHDQTDGLISTAKGDIKLFPAGNNIIPDADNDVDLGSSAASWKDLYVDGTCYCGSVIVNKFDRYIDIRAGAAVLGPTAPTTSTIGTFQVLEFDADAEQAFFTFEVPHDWAGAVSDDMTVRIYWVPEPGDVIADTETVKWDISYRVIDVDNQEVIDNGAATSGSVTYTQSGAGADKATRVSSIVLDADDANNPLVKGQVVGIAFDRDVTADTYSGKAGVIRWEIYYQSTTFKEH